MMVLSLLPIVAYYTTLAANISLALCLAGVVAFYVAWFHYPVDKPESCCVRMRAMLLSWQTGLMAALLVTVITTRSFNWALAFAYIMDGNSLLQASRLGHVGSDSFKVFHHYPDSEKNTIFTQYRLATADTYTTAGTTDRIGTIEVTGLMPATEYYYRVVVGKDTVVEDTKIVTAPAEGTPAKFTFTFGSCYMSQSMYGGLMYPPGLYGQAGMMNYFERLCGLWLPCSTAKA